MAPPSSSGENPAGGAVGDDEVLWRRVPPGRVKTDENGRIVTDSSAFQTRSGERGTSVDRARGHEERGDGPEILLADYTSPEGWGILAITAAQCRAAEVNGVTALDVVPDPLLGVDPPNPDHALIVPRVTKGFSGLLARAATWAKPPSS